MRSHPFIAAGGWLLLAAASIARADDEPGLTTLTNPTIAYTVPEKHYAVLHRGDVAAVVVDCEAVDDDVLPAHRGGYSGVGKLTHRKRPESLFVPNYAGLNFEHIHDGRTLPRDTLFECRAHPMELRLVDEHTVELYQSPTPYYGLESCHRYALLPDGAIELTVECVPRRETFANGYIGLFWASYIHQPESLDIHFLGYDDNPVGRNADGEVGRRVGRNVGDVAAFAGMRAAAPEMAFAPPNSGEFGHAAGEFGHVTRREPQWIRGVTPAHGQFPTHLAVDDDRDFPHDGDFPLSLVFNLSRQRYAQPWYYGISHGMAFAQVFRPRDRIRLSQSPSGGGQGNPAWDFQQFIPDPQVGQAYRLVMRAVYVPYESPEQVQAAVAPHRAALSP